ncbi:SAM-dependent methyltransferase [Synechococcus sp. CCY9201]|uniref:class I SAM-dependent methyltransferase n=1 Tax=Synechococcus sp. CCY9201 TaxID=174697 RepID=UPI002B2068F1|nr:SAM-dependent methyltransferase [Synechococcus sp. CCY9201]MEA5473975.1 SAM-dependent methyltransferase [Synechococcus sp. CCY9201]
MTRPPAPRPAPASSAPEASTPPAWLLERLRSACGSVPFRTFMAWALHDPEHGAYGSGHLRIGPRGDFATAPSLGGEFAALLAPQLAAWLEELAAQGSGPLALVETGPGEGQLARQLAEALQQHWPQLAARTELVLVEPNAGMAERQRRQLEGLSLPLRWASFEQLAAQPLRGVVLAHEVLDALAVERIVWDGALWRQQVVALHEGGSAGLALRLEPGKPLEPEALEQLAALGLPPRASEAAAGPAVPPLPAGWCTELHPELAPWLRSCAAGLSRGRLLVIDYALEARRYYAPQRQDGTLMAYRDQTASADPLRDPGHWDLTAHICLESLEAAALAEGWQPLGQCRQGEALLALGLAERLHGLQQGSGADLAALLARREALLRLVDPHALGDFRWLAFSKGEPGSLSTPAFLRQP